MKKVFLFLLPIGAVAIIAAYFIYNKPHRNMGKAEADLRVTASELFSEYETDETSANEKYLEKVVLVEGQVSDVSTNEEGNISLTLQSGNDMFGVICQFDKLSEHDRTEFAVGETVTIKGICTGMLMDVVLVRCVEV